MRKSYVVSNGVAPVRSNVKYDGYTSPSNPFLCAADAISLLISYEWLPARNSMWIAMSRLSNSVTDRKLDAAKEQRKNRRQGAA